jgi:hypothetical protein
MATSVLCARYEYNYNLCVTFKGDMVLISTIPTRNVKLKVVLVLNLRIISWRQRHVGNGNIAPCILNFHTRRPVSWSGCILPGKEPRYLVDKRFRGPQKSCRRCGEEKNLCPYWYSSPDYLSHSLIIMPRHKNIKALMFRLASQIISAKCFDNSLASSKCTMLRGCIRPAE